MATEVEQLYLQFELINIEEKMLKLQMLKHRRQRRRSRGWSVRPSEAEHGWMRLNNQCCKFTGVNLPVKTWRRRCQIHWCEFTTWMNKCTLDHFECQQASSPYTAIKTGKGSCRKLRSERTNHSPYTSTRRVVRIFWRCTSGYGGGVHVDAEITLKHKLWLSLNVLFH